MIPCIASVDLTPLNLTLRRPFVTAQGEKTVSKNLLVTARLADGTLGYGEASESLAWKKDSQEAMAQTLQKRIPSVLGKPIDSYHRLIQQLWEDSKHPTAIAALECALLDAYTRSQKISLWRWLGGKHRQIVTSLTISAWEPKLSGQVARQAALQGFKRLKIKVTGRDPEKDFQRILIVHRMAPKAQLWIDGNQGFTPTQAIRFARRLRQHQLPIPIWEQPVHQEDVEGLSQVEREGKIPVVADESARTLDQTRRLIRSKKVSAVNVKLAKSGLLGALQIIQWAKKGCVQLMIGCMAESAVGLTPSVHLACGSGEFDFVDLDSFLLMDSPPWGAGFTHQGSKLSV